MDSELTVFPSSSSVLQVFVKSSFNPHVLTQNHVTRGGAYSR